MAETQTGPLEPPWMRIARGELGVREPSDRVLQYIASVGGDPGDDWCAAFANWVLREAGFQPPGKRIARAFLKFGIPVESPRPGDLVVYWRGAPGSWQGHVAFFTRQTPTKIFGVGGNQDRAVTTKAYPRERLLGFRRPG